MDVIEAITARRGHSRLVAPAPTSDDLTTILAAAGHAPDHGCLRPWRFVVVEGEGYGRLGQVFAEAYRQRCAEVDEDPAPHKIEKEMTKLQRAPMVLVAIHAGQVSDKIPLIEQRDAVSAAVQNVLLTAENLGYATMWRTGEPAYDPLVHEELNVGADDDIIGFIYLGTAPPDERAKPPRDVDPWAYSSLY